jgi:hypothetical protein
MDNFSISIKQSKVVSVNRDEKEVYSGVLIFIAPTIM